MILRSQVIWPILYLHEFKHKQLVYKTTVPYHPFNMWCTSECENAVACKYQINPQPIPTRASKIKAAEISPILNDPKDFTRGFLWPHFFVFLCTTKQNPIKVAQSIPNSMLLRKSFQVILLLFYIFGHVVPKMLWKWEFHHCICVTFATVCLCEKTKIKKLIYQDLTTLYCKYLQLTKVCHSERIIKKKLQLVKVSYMSLKYLLICIKKGI